VVVLGVDAPGRACLLVSLFAACLFAVCCLLFAVCLFAFCCLLFAVNWGGFAENFKKNLMTAPSGFSECIRDYFVLGDLYK
jgi:hypothetical protein